MNSNLYNKVWDFPEDMRKHMKICFVKVKNADSNVEGFNRNKRLQSLTTIGYPELKRIKNFFDNFKGKQTDPSFILNGGVEIKNWVNDELRKMREYGHLTKQNKMDTGMQNSFIKPHEKKDFTNVRKSQEHSKTVERYNEAVTESLRRINELILKL